LVGQEKRETEALKLFHEEQNKKQAQELLEQYLAYKKVPLQILCAQGSHHIGDRESDEIITVLPCLHAYISVEFKKCYILVGVSFLILIVFKLFSRDWFYRKLRSTMERKRSKLICSIFCCFLIRWVEIDCQTMLCRGHIQRSCG
jgi:hypothetical protein